MTKLLNESLLGNNDPFIFEEDNPQTLNDQENRVNSSEPEAEKAWKILLVDDDSEVHQATKLVLKRFTFEGKPLTLISAYSG
ncbi:MAG TPA: response regulator receiver protein, partial [Cyanobacteria bacterium UBA11148]|nr:response regulator receiver protein [Cyanobacteria bacterium UBA11148]